MNEYRPTTNDYIITISYLGIEYRYRLQQYHTEIGTTYWHLFANGRILDLKFSHGKLTEELISGQEQVPADFLELIERELRDITQPGHS